MSTTFTVPRTARPISDDMFADLGVPLVSFEALPGGGQQVTVPADLTQAQVLRGKIRLLTSNADDEATLVAAVDAIASDDAYLALTAPTSAQAIAQVTALTRQVRGLIAWVGRDALS